MFYVNNILGELNIMNEKNNKPDISALKIDKSKKYDDRPKSKLWNYLTFLIVIIVIIIAYYSFQEKIRPATKVKIATAQLMSGSEAQASLVATGYVVAQRKAEVASKGTGRLKYLRFEEGDKVKTNEIIAELENEDIKANLDLAKAELLRAKTELLNAERQYKRTKELYKSGSKTKVEFENFETAFKLAQAALAGRIALVKVAEVNLENTIIRAPFDGTILTKNADVGEIVAPFASSSSSKGSVVTLADMKSLEVEADVSESNIHKVSVGQPCEIILDAYQNSPYPGYVKKIVPTADRARATVQTKIAFKQIDDKVLPEMSARVNFFFENKQPETDQSKPVIGIKKEAITNRDGQKIVFVIIENNVQSRNISIGRELGDITEITNGLKQGDKVVLSPPGKMKSGDKIEISY